MHLIGKWESDFFDNPWAYNSNVGNWSDITLIAGNIILEINENQTASVFVPSIGGQSNNSYPFELYKGKVEITANYILIFTSSQNELRKYGKNNICFAIEFTIINENTIRLNIFESQLTFRKF
jgi:hypothetical protein